MRTALPCLFLASLATACTVRNEPIAPHGSDVASVRGIDREGGEGAYVSGALETFALQFEGEAPEVIWTASAGALNASGPRATWRLPAPGIATLSATMRDDAGGERTLSWDFQIVGKDDSLATARAALLANPIDVADAGTADVTGSTCQIAYDSTNKVHLAYRNDTHPSLWYAVWNGSTWTHELVDGMGFNRGGLVAEEFAMVLDAAGNPHFAYNFEPTSGAYETWYATKVGGTWTRERVDSAYSTTYTGISLALNPAQSNRATIAFTSFISGTGTRVIVSERTAPGTWSQSRLTFSSTSNSQNLRGDILFDASGKLYVPYLSQLGTWNGTATEYFSLGASIDAQWASLVWGEAGTLLLRTSTSIIHVTPGTPFGASTRTISRLENSGSVRGDLVHASKPYVLHLHGDHLELVTSNAQNFFTYTQLGTARTTAVPALTVNPAGTVSICYQSPNGQILFQ